jgi:Ca2+-transporting ATPase
MDGPPALTLGLEGMDANLLNKKPISRNAPLVGASMLFKIAITAIFTATMSLLEYKYDFLRLGKNSVVTGVFTTFVLFQLFNAFNARELGSQSIFKSFTKNKIMLVTFALAFLLQFLIVTFGGAVFSTTPLSVLGWGKVLLLSSSVVAFSEIFKVVYNKINAKKHNKKEENA